MNVTLGHIVESGTVVIAAIHAAIVVVFYFLIASQQLRRVKARVETHACIECLVVKLLFIAATGIPIRALVVIGIVGISVTTEETIKLVTELMLQPAPERFAAITISVTIAAIR
ncbi:hypothetical protein D3C75_874150 [compost metagenome]